MHQSPQAPCPNDLAGFREVQRLAYRCAETIGADTRPDMTERQVAASTKTWLLDHGVTNWFQ